MSRSEYSGVWNGCHNSPISVLFIGHIASKKSGSCHEILIPVDAERVDSPYGRQ